MYPIRQGEVEIAAENKVAVGDYKKTLLTELSDQGTHEERCIYLRDAGVTVQHIQRRMGFSSKSECVLIVESDLGKSKWGDKDTGSFTSVTRDELADPRDLNIMDGYAQAVAGGQEVAMLITLQNIREVFAAENIDTLSAKEAMRFLIDRGAGSLERLASEQGSNP